MSPTNLVVLTKFQLSVETLNSLKLYHMEQSFRVKKYEADITKYKAVIEVEEKILEECMDSATNEK